jgi:hypothetical protein
MQVAFGIRYWLDSCSQREPGKEHPVKVDSARQTSNSIVNSPDRAAEVTGLGVIAALMIAFGSLVIDGSLPLSQYLVFATFLLVSAGGLGWRMWRLAPGRTANPQNRSNGATSSFGRRN